MLGGGMPSFTGGSATATATGQNRSDITGGDWGSDGGPVGQELMFNCVDIHPYFPYESEVTP
jgi:hypothetical protein